MDRLRHPLERWPRANRRLILIVLAVIAVLPAVLDPIADPLKTDVHDETIIDFELAGSVERAEEILAAWDAAGVIDDAKAIQIFDLVYPLIYGFALAGACIAAAGAWRRRGREGWARVGLLMAWVTFAAVGFDYVENLGLGISLWDEPMDPWPQVAYGAAIAKFAGIYLALAYALTGIVAWALSRRGRPPASARPQTPSPGSPSAG